nr:MASE3 domain-containing protein [Tissierella sp.]
MDTYKRRFLDIFKIYKKIAFVFVFSIAIYILAAIFNNSFGKIMPEASFLTWHTLFEFASILVSFSIFSVTYFIYEESRSLRMLIFASAFLLTGCLDIFHTFSYKGMPYFLIANVTANRSTVLWILSRLLGNLLFIAAILTPSKIISNIRKELVAVITILFSIVLVLLVTYYPNLFPTMYIEGQGLTRVKILIEYFIMLILTIAFIIISIEYNKTKAKNEFKLMLAIILLIFSEFAFTSYGSIYDAFNYIGHLYKLIGYSILYKAIYIKNVITPFREIKRTKNELKKYSENLNFLVSQRTKQLEDLNKVLLSDIEYAKEMQLCLLPEKMPTNMSVDFKAEYLPADNLSGDFYNVVKLDEENIAVYIGDVSGHGISAAMLTVFAYQNVIHLNEKDGTDKELIEPGFVLKNIYNSFNETNINEEKYIVMLYGIYNTSHKTFQYASAGINVEPYIIKHSGEVHPMKVKGFPICKLGDMVNPFYKNETVQLEIGDKILFYSDGLVEAKNKEGKDYGQEKLKAFLENNYTLGPSDLNSAIKNDFFKFKNYNKELSDDVTFLTMDILK